MLNLSAGCLYILPDFSFVIIYLDDLWLVPSSAEDGAVLLAHDVTRGRSSIIIIIIIIIIIYIYIIICIIIYIIIYTYLSIYIYIYIHTYVLYNIYWLFVEDCHMRYIIYAVYNIGFLRFVHLYHNIILYTCSFHRDYGRFP